MVQQFSITSIFVEWGPSMPLQAPTNRQSMETDEFSGVDHNTQQSTSATSDELAQVPRVTSKTNEDQSTAVISTPPVHPKSTNTNEPSTSTKDHIVDRPQYYNITYSDELGNEVPKVEEMLHLAGRCSDCADMLGTAKHQYNPVPSISRKIDEVSVYLRDCFNLVYEALGMIIVSEMPMDRLHRCVEMVIDLKNQCDVSLLKEEIGLIGQYMQIGVKKWEEAYPFSIGNRLILD